MLCVHISIPQTAMQSAVAASYTFLQVLSFCVINSTRPLIFLPCLHFARVGFAPGGFLYLLEFPKYVFL